VKKIFSILLIIMLFFSLNACTIKAEQQTKEEKVQSENSDTGTQGTNEEIIKGSENLPKEVKNHIKFQIGEYVFTAALEENSSAEALMALLKERPITIDMQDYANMEKVGFLDTKLPRNDEHILTEPGDLILYQGNAFVIYYASNSWDFTRIGKIDNVTQKELIDVLGNGSIKVTLFLD